MKRLLVLSLVVSQVCLTGKASPSLCEVYPSEYAYREDSVTRSEQASANCRGYLNGARRDNCKGYEEGRNMDHVQDYIHCDSTQLKLTDSDLRSEQYNSSDYYVWSATTISSQLLFIFPTRVDLTTITLHYYSDIHVLQGLPRLRFYAVPNDFDVWDAPKASYENVEVAAMPPGGEPVGQRNINLTFNFNTTKVLMHKSESNFSFAVNEVEFFTYIHCSELIQGTCTFSTLPKEMLKNESPVSSSEVVAWILVSILTVLFIGLVTVNIIVLWVYKKRQTRDIDGQVTKYEMEDNPCYDAVTAKQTTDAGAHVYEAVRVGGVK